MVSIQVAHAVVSDSVFPVGNLRYDFYAIDAMEFIELVRIAHEKGHGASFRTGRPLPQEHLYLAYVHAGESRRIATPRERQFEAQLFGVEVYGGGNIADRQYRMDLITFDEGRGRGRHGVSSYLVKI